MQNPHHPIQYQPNPLIACGATSVLDVLYSFLHVHPFLLILIQFRTLEDTLPLNFIKIFEITIISPQVSISFYEANVEAIVANCDVKGSFGMFLKGP